jgi:hypothetical protein
MIGGGFLLEATRPADVFTPEDFSEEHHAIRASTTDEFFANEVAPSLEAIQHQEPGVAVRILKQVGGTRADGGHSCPSNTAAWN